MRNTVTYDLGGGDRGDLERIYDRLRKRSYRRNLRTMRELGFSMKHEAYIQGIKDALNAVMEGDK